MPTSAKELDPRVSTDSADLSRFGYTQQLHRRLGSYASFAAGFSFVSILTTVFQLFAFGYSFGGPRFFWTWPLVFTGQFLVALVFAELAARYPIAGCVYQWSRRLSGGVTGWFAGELSEETRRPRRTAPRAILRALAVSGIGGAAVLLTGLMAAPSLTDGKLATTGLPYVLTSTLGPGVGKALLVDVTVAICVCTLAVQTASTRLMFSMARDGSLPGGRLLARVNRRTGAPIWPAVITGLVAIGLLGVNVGQAQLFGAITSVAVVIVYLAYLLVTGPALVRRLRRTYPAAEGGFSLGRAGLLVNVLAVGYGIGMAVNIGWPRAAVYDPAGGNRYLQWFSVLFLAGVVLAGAVAYGMRSRRPTSAVIQAEPALATGG